MKYLICQTYGQWLTDWDGYAVVAEFRLRSMEQNYGYASTERKNDKGGISKTTI